MENGDLFVPDVTGDAAPSEIPESSSNVDRLEEASISGFLAESEGTTRKKDKELESSSSSTQEVKDSKDHHVHFDTPLEDFYVTGETPPSEIPESSSNVDRLEEASTSRFLADSEGTTGEKDKQLESSSSSTQEVKDSEEPHVHFDTPLEDFCASNDHQLDGSTSGASLYSHQTPSSGTASSRGFYADFENTSECVEKSSAGYRKLSITLTDQWLSVRKAVESRRPASSIDSTVTEEMKRRYREMLQRKRKVSMMQRTRDDREIRIMKRNKFHHKFYFSDSDYPESTEYSTTSSSTAELVSVKEVEKVEEVEEMSADSPHVTTGRLQRIWRRCRAAIRGLCCCLGKDEKQKILD